MSGYMEKGFMYEATIDDSIDIDLARKILYEADRRLVGGEFFSTRLRGLDLGGRLVPFFSKANYTVTELEGKVSQGRGHTPAGERLGGLAKLHPGLGGMLREKVHEYSRELESRRWVIAVTWQRPYLKYLIEHGKSRHPGTTTQFVERIKSKGEVARYLRAEIAAICHNAGVPASAISVTFGGMIEA